MVVFVSQLSYDDSSPSTSPTNVPTLSSKPFFASLIQKIHDVSYTKKETKNLVSKCVQKLQFHEVLTDLREEIDGKSSEVSLDQLSQHCEDTRALLAEFQNDYEVTKRRALLATQFVDWYSRREE